jgi:GalNAc-alpha-(1->4)-GalNAc-alpha-(1->3)-diNAcBac-PP-undecaprenol alpha-1,4-N-acetyl-D-galactosaminyltransferase
VRVTFVISSLHGGGAERVMSIMANYWAARAWDIHILTLDDGSEPPFYDLDPAIVHVSLHLLEPAGNLLKGLHNNIRRIRRLRKALNSTRPDAIIAFMERSSVLTVLAATGTGRPVIVSERNDPHYQRLGRVWIALREWTYRSASRLIVQTEYAKQYYSRAIQSHTQVIPNPVLDAPAPRESISHIDDNMPQTAIAMGSLVDDKGFDLLLYAFARIAAECPSWSLQIWGEGPLRGQLESLIRDLKLDGRVTLPGRTKKPHCVMRKAELFVLSSRTEGFPNVLCEAMASGLPVIGFDVGGVGEIAHNNIDAVIVPEGDVEMLAQGMKRLMLHAAERQALAARAPNVNVRFQVDKVMAMWEEVIQGAIT